MSFAPPTTKNIIGFVLSYSSMVSFILNVEHWNVTIEIRHQTYITIESTLKISSAFVQKHFNLGLWDASHPTQDGIFVTTRMMAVTFVGTKPIHMPRATPVGEEYLEMTGSLYNPGMYKTL